MMQQDVGKIMTVCGPISVAEAGYTLSHEHLLCDLWAFLRSYDAVLDDEKLAIDEISDYRKAGGSTIIDCTSGGLGRNPGALRRISTAASESGFNIDSRSSWMRSRL